MRRLSLAVVAFLCFGIAVYAVGTYGFGPGAKQLHPDMQASFQNHPFAIATHVFASALALVLGPMQFSRRLRSRNPRLHRWTGRVYLGVAVALGGTAGLYMSYHAFGGVPAKLGFAGLALAWLYTGARAFSAARRRDLTAHRRWMIRNFSLAFAAVTLRLYLPAVFILQHPFASAYAVIAWISWLPNLLVAEALIAATRQRSAPGTSSGEVRLPPGAAHVER